MNRIIIWITGILGVIVLFSSCGSNNSNTKVSFEKALSVNDSITLLTHQIQKDSTNAELWKTRSKLYLRNGNVDFSFRDLNQALDLNNTDPGLFILLADLYFTIGKVDNSLSAIKKAISLQPENPDSYLKMAGFQLILQKYPSANAYADKVISLDPENAKAYYIKAISALEQKDTSNAIVIMKIAANLDTSFYAANFNIAVLLDAQNDATAKNYYQKALQNKPDDIIARYSLGMLYQKNKQFNKAMDVYNELIKLHPDNAAAYFNIGYIYLTELLEFENAEKAFSKAIEIKPDYTAAVYNLGRTYEVMGKTELAKEKYRDALKLTTNYSLAIEGLNRLE